MTDVSGTAGGDAGRPLRWGILGTGRIAGAFATDLALDGSGIVVAVGSRTQAGADAFGDRFAIPHRHGSYGALLADPEVDAVYVATPHPMHCENALAAIAHGRPVLVEKAFTMNGAEARQVADAARAAGVFAMEAMWSRFLPHMVEIRRLVGGGTLGRVVVVTADFGRHFEPDPSSRLFAPELGGGALLDLGVYALSLASMVLGRPGSVHALVEPAFTGVDGLTSMVLGYGSGAHAVLTCTSLAESASRASIIGTEARIDIDERFYAPTSFTLVPRVGSPVRFDRPHEGRGLRHQAREVARCLRAGLGESPVMPLDESVAVMETVDAVLAAAR